MCPFQIENEFINKLGDAPKSTTPNGVGKILVETMNEEQSKKLTDENN